MGLNQDLRDSLLARQIDLHRFVEWENDRIQVFFQGMYADMEARLTGQSIGAGPVRQAQLNALLATYNKSIQAHFGELKKWVGRDLTFMAAGEVDYVRNTINKAADRNLMINALTPGFLDKIVNGSLVNGSPMSDWWGKQSKDVQTKISQSIRMGMAQGDSIQDIVKRVRGEKTGRKKRVLHPTAGIEQVLEVYEGGVAGWNRQATTAVVRTGTMKIAADARRDMFFANPDVVKGLKQISTLDGRTTEICALYDSEAWLFEAQDFEQRQISAYEVPEVFDAELLPSTYDKFKDLPMAAWQEFRREFPEAFETFLRYCEEVTTGAQDPADVAVRLMGDAKDGLLDLMETYFTWAGANPKISKLSRWAVEGGLKGAEKFFEKKYGFRMVDFLRDLDNLPPALNWWKGIQANKWMQFCSRHPELYAEIRDRLFKTTKGIWPARLINLVDDGLAEIYGIKDIDPDLLPPVLRFYEELRYSDWFNFLQTNPHVADDLIGRLTGKVRGWTPELIDGAFEAYKTWGTSEQLITWMKRNPGLAQDVFERITGLTTGWSETAVDAAFDAYRVFGKVTEKRELRLLRVSQKFTKLTMFGKAGLPPSALGADLGMKVGSHTVAEHLKNLGKAIIQDTELYQALGQFTMLTEEQWALVWKKRPKIFTLLAEHVDSIKAIQSKKVLAEIKDSLQKVIGVEVGVLKLPPNKYQVLPAGKTLERVDIPDSIDDLLPELDVPVAVGHPVMPGDTLKEVQEAAYTARLDYEGQNITYGGYNGWNEPNNFAARANQIVEHQWTKMNDYLQSPGGYPHGTAAEIADMVKIMDEVIDQGDTFPVTTRVYKPDFPERFLDHFGLHEKDLMNPDAMKVLQDAIWDGDGSYISANLYREGVMEVVGQSSSMRLVVEIDVPAGTKFKRMYQPDDIPIDFDTGDIYFARDQKFVIKSYPQKTPTGEYHVVLQAVNKDLVDDMGESLVTAIDLDDVPGLNIAYYRLADDVAELVDDAYPIPHVKGAQTVTSLGPDAQAQWALSQTEIDIEHIVYGGTDWDIQPVHKVVSDLKIGDLKDRIYRLVYAPETISDAKKAITAQQMAYLDQMMEHAPDRFLKSVTVYGDDDLLEFLRRINALSEAAETVAAGLENPTMQEQLGGLLTAIQIGGSPTQEQMDALVGIVYRSEMPVFANMLRENARTKAFYKSMHGKRVLLEIDVPEGMQFKHYKAATWIKNQDVDRDIYFRQGQNWRIKSASYDADEGSLILKMEWVDDATMKQATPVAKPLPSKPATELPQDFTWQNLKELAHTLYDGNKLASKDRIYTRLPIKSQEAIVSLMDTADTRLSVVLMQEDAVSGIRDLIRQLDLAVKNPNQMIPGDDAAMKALDKTISKVLAMDLENLNYWQNEYVKHLGLGDDLIYKWAKEFGDFVTSKGGDTAYLNDAVYDYKNIVEAIYGLSPDHRLLMYEDPRVITVMHQMKEVIEGTRAPGDLDVVAGKAFWDAMSEAHDKVYIKKAVQEIAEDADDWVKAANEFLTAASVYDDPPEIIAKYNSIANALIAMTPAQRKALMATDANLALLSEMNGFVLGQKSGSSLSPAIVKTFNKFLKQVTGATTSDIYVFAKQIADRAEAYLAWVAAQGWEAGEVPTTVRLYEKIAVMLRDLPPDQRIDVVQGAGGKAYEMLVKIGNPPPNFNAVQFLDDFGLLYSDEFFEAAAHGNTSAQVMDLISGPGAPTVDKAMEILAEGGPKALAKEFVEKHYPNLPSHVSFNELKKAADIILGMTDAEYATLVADNVNTAKVINSMTAVLQYSDNPYEALKWVGGEYPTFYKVANEILSEADLVATSFSEYVTAAGVFENVKHVPGTLVDDYAAFLNYYTKALLDDEVAEALANSPAFKALLRDVEDYAVGKLPPEGFSKTVVGQAWAAIHKVKNQAYTAKMTTFYLGEEFVEAAAKAGVPLDELGLLIDDFQTIAVKAWEELGEKFELGHPAASVISQARWLMEQTPEVRTAIYANPKAGPFMGMVQGLIDGDITPDDLVGNASIGSAINAMSEAVYHAKDLTKGAKVTDDVGKLLHRFLVQADALDEFYKNDPLISQYTVLAQKMQMMSPEDRAVFLEPDNPGHALLEFMRKWADEGQAFGPGADDAVIRWYSGYSQALELGATEVEQMQLLRLRKFTTELLIGDDPGLTPIDVFGIEDPRAVVPGGTVYNSYRTAAHQLYSMSLDDRTYVLSFKEAQELMEVIDKVIDGELDPLDLTQDEYTGILVNYWNDLVEKLVEEAGTAAAGRPMVGSPIYMPPKDFVGGLAHDFMISVSHIDAAGARGLSDFRNIASSLLDLSVEERRVIGALPDIQDILIEMREVLDGKRKFFNLSENMWGTFLVKHEQVRQAMFTKGSPPIGITKEIMDKITGAKEKIAAPTIFEEVGEHFETILAETITEYNVELPVPVYAALEDLLLRTDDEIRLVLQDARAQELLAYMRALHKKEVAVSDIPWVGPDGIELRAGFEAALADAKDTKKLLRKFDFTPGAEATAENILAQKIGEQGGSMPGGLYLGADNVKRYCKFYSDPSQAYCELVANRIYQALGIDVPESALFEHEGLLVIANTWVEDLDIIGATWQSKSSERFARGFYADVLMMNWDAVGLGYDNAVLQTTSGKIFRVDQGGCLLFRAQGERKGMATLESLSELSGYFKPSRTYGKVMLAGNYGNHLDLGEKGIRQLLAIKMLREQSDDFAAFMFDMPGVPEADKQLILKVLRDRADKLDEILAETGHAIEIKKSINPSAAVEQIKEALVDDPTLKVLKTHFYAVDVEDLTEWATKNPKYISEILDHVNGTIPMQQATTDEILGSLAEKFPNATPGKAAKKVLEGLPDEFKTVQQGFVNSGLKGLHVDPEGNLASDVKWTDFFGLPAQFKFLDNVSPDEMVMYAQMHPSEFLDLLEHASGTKSWKQWEYEGYKSLLQEFFGTFGGLEASPVEEMAVSIHTISDHIKRDNNMILYGLDHWAHLTPEEWGQFAQAHERTWQIFIEELNEGLPITSDRMGEVARKLDEMFPPTRGGFTPAELLEPRPDSMGAFYVQNSFTEFLQQRVDQVDGISDMRNLAFINDDLLEQFMETFPDHLGIYDELRMIGQGRIDADFTPEFFHYLDALTRGDADDIAFMEKRLAGKIDPLLQDLAGFARWDCNQTAVNGAYRLQAVREALGDIVRMDEDYAQLPAIVEQLKNTFNQLLMWDEPDFKKRAKAWSIAMNLPGMNTHLYRLERLVYSGRWFRGYAGRTTAVELTELLKAANEITTRINAGKTGIRPVKEMAARFRKKFPDTTDIVSDVWRLADELVELTDDEIARFEAWLPTNKGLRDAWFYLEDVTTGSIAPPFHKMDDLAAWDVLVDQGLVDGPMVDPMMTTIRTYMKLAKEGSQAKVIVADLGGLSNKARVAKAIQEITDDLWILNDDALDYVKVRNYALWERLRDDVNARLNWAQQVEAGQATAAAQGIPKAMEKEALRKELGDIFRTPEAAKTWKTKPIWKFKASGLEEHWLEHGPSPDAVYEEIRGQVRDDLEEYLDEVFERLQMEHPNGDRITEAMVEYTGDAYTTYNDFKRGKLGDYDDLSEWQQELIDAVDQFWENEIMEPMIEEPIIVYRGTGFKGISQGTILDTRDLDDPAMLIGMTFEDGGLGSCSKMREFANGWAPTQGVLMKVEVPKGSRGIFMGPKSSHSNEVEFTLGPGTEYQIIGVGYRMYQGDPYLYLRVRVISSGGKKVSDYPIPVGRTFAESVPEAARQKAEAVIAHENWLKKVHTAAGSMEIEDKAQQLGGSWSGYFFHAIDYAEYDAVEEIFDECVYGHIEFFDNLGLWMEKELTADQVAELSNDSMFQFYMERLHNQDWDAELVVADGGTDPESLDEVKAEINDLLTELHQLLGHYVESWDTLNFMDLGPQYANELGMKMMG
jgi:hypothetical protein